MQNSSKFKTATEFFNCVSLELRKKNRFQNKDIDRLVDLLISENSNIEILKKATFKRARIYTEPDAIERFLNPPNSKFEGYDATNSFVNTYGTEGRCNPKFIPYLYVSNLVGCCIAEINPSIDSIISVANIKATEELRILNLSKRFAISRQSGSVVQDMWDCDLVMHLQYLFSRPYEQEGDYLLTQYISEKIKNSGFDGLSYYSSKYAYKSNSGTTERGCNFVIFNYEKCEAVSSKLYRVKAIEIKHSTSKSSHTN